MASNIDILIKAVDQASAQLRAVSAEMRNLASTGTAAAATVKRDWGQIGQSLRTSGETIRTVGTNLTMLALPVIGAGAAAVKMSMDYELAMSRIKGLVGASDAQIKQWSKDILSLAPEVAKSPDELAQALYFVTSAGIEASKALDVVRASARAATAGLGETQVVADAVTSAMMAYGAGNLSAADATGILVATVRLGKAEADAVAGSFGRVIPVASQLGISFDQVGAAIAAMTVKGISADEAVTSLRGIMVELLKPSSQAQAALASIGLSADGLRKQLKEKGLLSVLETLSSAIGDNNDVMAAVFPNVRALTGVFNLMGENLGQVQDIFKQMATAGEADLDKAFGATQQTKAFKFQQALTEMRVEMIKLGDSLAPIAASLIPVLSSVASGIGKIADAFSSLPAPVQTGIAALILLVAALGPILYVVGTITSTIGGLITIGSTVASIAPAFMGLIGPIGLVILAIVALAIAGYLIYKNWDAIKAFAIKVWNEIKDRVGGVLDALRGVFTSFGDWVVNHWKQIVTGILLAVFPPGAGLFQLITRWDDIVAGVKRGVNAVGAAMGELGGKIRSGLGRARGAIASTFAALGSQIADAWDAAWGALTFEFGPLFTNVIRPVFEGIANFIRAELAIYAELFRRGFAGVSAVVTNVFDGIVALVKFDLALLRGVISIGLSVVTTIFRAVWEPIAAIVQGVLGVIVNAVEANLSTLSAVWNAYWSALTTIVTAVFSVLSGVVRSSLDLVVAVISTFFIILKGIWDAGWGTITATVEAIWTMVTSIVQTNIAIVRDVITAILAVIRGDWGAAWDALRDIPGQALSQLSTLILTPLNLVKTTVMTWLNELKETFTSLMQPWEWVKSAWDDLVGGIEGALGAIFGSGIITDWVGRLKAFMSSAIRPWEWVKGPFDALVSGIRSAVSGIGDLIVGAFDNVAPRVSGAVGSIVGAVRKGASDLASGAVDLGKAGLNKAKDVWSTVNPFGGGFDFGIGGGGEYGVGPTSAKSPVAGSSLTQGFGKTAFSSNYASGRHSGVDYGAPIGAPIRAAQPGRVISAGWNNGYGYTVIVQSAAGVQELYGHMSRIEVALGQSISVGQLLGRVGSTGRSTGPHLHFEVRVNDRPVDPFGFLRGAARGVRNWFGGPVIVGERGPEIVTLPRGADVYPNNSAVTKTVISQTSIGGKSLSSSLARYVGGAVVHDEDVRSLGGANVSNSFVHAVRAFGGRVITSIFGGREGDRYLTDSLAIGGPHLAVRRVTINNVGGGGSGITNMLLPAIGARQFEPGEEPIKWSFNLQLAQEAAFRNDLEGVYTQFRLGGATVKAILPAYDALHTSILNTGIEATNTATTLTTTMSSVTASNTQVTQVLTEQQQELVALRDAFTSSGLSEEDFGARLRGFSSALAEGLTVIGGQFQQAGVEVTSTLVMVLAGLNDFSSGIIQQQAQILASRAEQAAGVAATYGAGYQVTVPQTPKGQTGPFGEGFTIGGVANIAGVIRLFTQYGSKVFDYLMPATEQSARVLGLLQMAIKDGVTGLEGLAEQFEYTEANVRDLNYALTAMYRAQNKQYNPPAGVPGHQWTRQEMLYVNEVARLKGEAPPFKNVTANFHGPVNITTRASISEVIADLSMAVR